MTAAPSARSSPRAEPSPLRRCTGGGKRRVSPEAPFLLIEGGHLYTPDPAGPGSVLIACGRIVEVGGSHFGDKLRTPQMQSVDVLDATGCIVTPGLIDPHEHLIGGSGEHGFHSQTPEIFLQELIEGAI